MVKKNVKRSTKKKVKNKAVKKTVKKKAVKKTVNKAAKPDAKKPAKKEAAKGREIRIVNIVVSGSLDKSKIPLEKMAATLPNTEYNPEQFPGLVLRIREPKTSALIFNSGKIVCTGARSMEKVDEAMVKIVEAMKKIGIEIKKKPEYQVQNMVASGSIGLSLNLNTLAIRLENTEYEPEQFPGLVYKLRGTKATFLLFTNGEIVCTGTKSEEEVHEAVKKLVEVLKNVMKKK